MDAALIEAVIDNGRPFLGICVGMQLMATRGLEHGETRGLDWIAGDVEAIEPADPSFKIPHMGWNTLNLARPHPLFAGIKTGEEGLHAYFVHSYQLTPRSREDLVADRRLWRAAHRRRGAGKSRRRAVSSRKEPKARSGSHRQFSEVASVILFPAIDLKEGQCVRLAQGDMTRATVFNDDPAKQARAFERQGFEYLHVVDLDGAFAGAPRNASAVEAILAALKIPVQLGGGIREMRTIARWLEKGVARVIIGTAAVKDPALVREAARLYPGRIAVGIDAKDGMVAVEGWARTTRMSALDLGRSFENAGVAAIVYTDIARDGILKGLNMEATLALADALTIPVIASGGLASLEDVERLTRPDCAKLAGAITGRALYDGRLDPAEALALFRGAGRSSRASA